MRRLRLVINSLLLLVMVLLLLPQPAAGWTYDSRRPSSPAYWGRVAPACSSHLAPWQSPMPLRSADTARVERVSASIAAAVAAWEEGADALGGHIVPPQQERSHATTAAPPIDACVISSVINSSDPRPLEPQPMLLERLAGGLLLVRPVGSGSSGGSGKAVPSDETRRGLINDGLTVRISVRSGGKISIVPGGRDVASSNATSGATTTTTTAPDANNGSNEVDEDLYRLEAVAVHTGSEHGAEVWNAIGELQLILNPINAHTTATTTAAPAAGQVQHPPRRQQSLHRPRTTVLAVPLVTPATPAGARLASPARSFVSELLREIRLAAVTAAATNSPAVQRAIGEEGDPEGPPQAAAGSSVLDVGVAGMGGISGSRTMWPNTVPLLPVPVRSVNTDASNGPSLVPKAAVLYGYEGTLTFPPCLPLAAESAIDGTVNLADLHSAYQPTNATPLRYIPTRIGNTNGAPILVSIPTVRYFITAPFATSQTVINSLVLLSGTVTASVTAPTAAPNSAATTYAVPITTSRPPQPANGRTFLPIAAALPLVEDRGVQAMTSAAAGRSEQIVITSDDGMGPTVINGITPLSQVVAEQHITVVRAKQLNIRLRTACTVLLLLCLCVAAYNVLLLLVRYDYVEIPTGCGGKRTAVDFWANPRSVLPARFDSLDADHSFDAEETMSESVESADPNRHQRRPDRHKKRRFSRSWQQEDESDSQTDQRMLMSAADSARSPQRGHGRHSNARSMSSPATKITLVHPSPAVPMAGTDTNHTQAAVPTALKAPTNPLQRVTNAVITAPHPRLAFNMQPTNMDKAPKAGGGAAPRPPQAQGPLSPERADNPLLPLSQQTSRQ